MFGEAKSQKLQFNKNGEDSKKIKAELQSFKVSQGEDKFSKSFTDFHEVCNAPLQI